jgi:sensor histidine kinase YesM
MAHLPSVTSASHAPSSPLTLKAKCAMMWRRWRLWFSWRDWVVFLLVNSGCALLTALTLTYFYQENSQFFFKQWPEYTLVYVLVSLFLLLTYLYLRVVRQQSITPRFMVTMTVLTFGLTLSALSVIFTWFSWAQLADGAFFILHFMASSGWALFLMFYVHHKVVQPLLEQRTEQLAASQRENSRLASELQLLSAQLEPHFFFNTLANLHSLIEEDPHKAQQLVEALSQYLRRCLPYFRLERIALADELVVVQQYVAIQNIRFEQRIRLQLDIASGVQFTSILPMTLLTLVENAIKHGLSKTNGGNISIGVEKAQAYIWLRVTDDADQLSAAQHGTGLANLVTRLQLRYGDAATLQLQRLCHGMTEALIRIPCDD